MLSVDDGKSLGGQFLAALLGNDNNNFELCWSRILPFLTTKDAVALSHTNKRLRTIVAKFYESGGRLVIDKNVTTQFPIANHCELFARYGKDARTVTISGIDDDELERLFEHFPNIISLTLTDLWILRDIRGGPEKIQQLKIANCKMHSTFVERWFQLISPTLDCLHLDRSPCGDVLNMDVTNYINAIAYSNVRELVLLGMNINFCHNIAKYFPSLECLSINAASASETKAPIDSRLELKYFVLEDQSLDSVFCRIRESKYQRINLQIIRCSSKDERLILNSHKEHLIEEIIRDSGFSPPTESNLILNKLNDDCLVKILSYLSWSDYMELCITHPRFEKCFLDNTVSRGTLRICQRSNIPAIDATCFPLEEYRKAFKAILHNINSLELQRVNSSTACELLSYCKNLKDLNLRSMDLDVSTQDIDTFPNELTTLQMDSTSINEDFWKKWTRRLDSTLWVLKFQYNDEGLDMSNLHNIRVFETFRYHDNLETFLDQIKDTLEDLTIKTIDNNNLCQVLPNLKNLRKLSFRAFHPDRSCDLSGLIHLEEVTHHPKVIVNKNNIKKLVVERYALTGVIDEIVEYKNLKQLNYYGILQSHRPLRTLKRLRTLRLARFNDQQRMDIITDLSPLTRIEVDGPFDWSMDFLFWLRTYLRATERNLEIVSSEATILFSNGQLTLTDLL